jgi:hypothetical protein
MIPKIAQQNRKAIGWMLHSSDRIVEIEKRIKFYEQYHPNKISRARKWSVLISDLTEKLPQEHLIVMIIRREYRHSRKSDGWRISAVAKYKEMTGKTIHPKTFGRLWSECVESVVREALERKLL